MSYRKILVGLADEQTAPRVMTAATALARTSQAHLLGVHIVPAGIDRDDQGHPTDNLGERLGRVYAQHCRNETFTTEWRVIDKSDLSATGAMVEFGNACDILVMGQRHAREAGRPRWHLGEHVVGMTTRPVLLVPDSDKAKFAARRILLAWDGGAVATRTIFNALPLLRHASSVRLHRLNPPQDERGHVSSTAEEFATTLARHGVSLELSHSDAPESEIASELLSLAEEFDADVLVSGCQVHGLLRDSLMGSTTRHLFAFSNRPLLMGS